MRPSLPNSPMKLVLLTILGSVLSCTLFLLPAPHSHSAFNAALIFALALFAGGTILWLKSVSRLKNGVENELWPESQIEPLRMHLESPYYSLLSIALLVAYVLFQFLFKHLRTESWACFLLLQTISQLRISLRRPRIKAPPVIWRNFAPIHSEHWGER